jgi:hypothetical protein
MLLIILLFILNVYQRLVSTSCKLLKPLSMLSRPPAVDVEVHFPWERVRETLPKVKNARHVADSTVMLSREPEAASRDNVLEPRAKRVWVHGMQRPATIFAVMVAVMMMMMRRNVMMM